MSKREGEKGGLRRESLLSIKYSSISLENHSKYSSKKHVHNPITMTSSSYLYSNEVAGKDDGVEGVVSCLN